MYYVYILRCEDNSLYTGITSDVKRRVSEHFFQKSRCARYTKSHKVKDLAAVFGAGDKSSALKCEIALKKLSKEEKEQLVKSCDGFREFGRIEGITLDSCIGSTKSDSEKVDK